MKFIYNGNSNKSGVYKIINTTNGRIYIGSAKLFKTRAQHHIKSLLKGTHHNKFLQHDFNKCGKDAFEFHILKVVEAEKDVRFFAEQKYVDEYFDNQDLCYNFKKKTVQKERSCYSKTPEETSQLISENMKRLWSDPEYKQKGLANMTKIQKYKTKEMYEKVSKALTGKKLSPEHIEKIKKASFGKKLTKEQKQMRRDYKHTPEAIEKIREYQKGRKKSPEQIVKQSGENHWTKKHGGHSEEAKEKMRKAKQKIAQKIKATNIKTGEVLIFNSLREAERNLPMKRPSIKNALKGKKKHSKGFMFEIITQLLLNNI